MRIEGVQALVDHVQKLKPGETVNTDSDEDERVADFDTSEKKSQKKATGAKSGDQLDVADEEKVRLESEENCFIKLCLGMGDSIIPLKELKNGSLRANQALYGELKPIFDIAEPSDPEKAAQ